MTVDRISVQYDPIEPVSPLTGTWRRARAWFETARKGSLYSLAVALYVGYEALTKRNALLAIGVLAWLVVYYGVILPRRSSRIETPAPVPAEGPAGTGDAETRGGWEGPRWERTDDEEPGDGGDDERRT